MSRIRQENSVDVTAQALEAFLQERAGLPASAALIGCEYCPRDGCVRFYVAGPEQTDTWEGAQAPRFATVTANGTLHPDYVNDIRPAGQAPGASLEVTPTRRR